MMQIVQPGQRLNLDLLDLYQGSHYTFSFGYAADLTGKSAHANFSATLGQANPTMAFGVGTGISITPNSPSPGVSTITLDIPASTLAALQIQAGVFDVFVDPHGAQDDASFAIVFGKWQMALEAAKGAVPAIVAPPAPQVGDTLSWNGSAWINVPAISAGEMTFWQHQAALLDPSAYRYYQQTVSSPTLPVTVPNGKAWYLRNSAALQSGDGTSDVRVKYFRNAREKMVLSAGTTLTAQATNGFAYVCQPELVIANDARYTSDPKGLYYARLSQLQSLTQKDASCGSGLTQALTAPTSGICMALAVSQFEITWALLSNSNNVNAINLISEIDDAMTSRFSSELMLPFPISIFNQITRGINLGATDTPGCLTLTYAELPVGW